MNRIALLILSWLAVSAFSVPCVYFCTDQTRIQENYVASRDDCREVAELKADMYNDTDKSVQQRKTRLVAIFSECMGTRGWTVPGPAETKDKDKDKTAAAAPAAEKMDVKRAAQCAYARQSEDASGAASRDARMCDEECIQGLHNKLSETPLPAACPPEGSARLERLRGDPRLNPIAAPVPVSSKPLNTPKKKKVTHTKSRQKTVPKKTAVAKPAKPATTQRSSPESVLEQGLKKN